MAFRTSDPALYDNKLSVINEGLERPDWSSIKQAWSDSENGADAEILEMSDGEVCFFLCGSLSWSSNCETLYELDPDIALEVKDLTDYDEELPFEFVSRSSLGKRVPSLADIPDDAFDDFSIADRAEKALGKRVLVCRDGFAVYE